MNRWVWICMLVAAVLRVGAATGLPMDADEPVYLKSADRYAAVIHARTPGALLDQPHNPEHPALMKLVHGVGLAFLGPNPGLVQRLAVVRGVEASGGVLLAGVLARVHPAAGMAAALHTLHTKYTAQGYLEAWPMFAMLLALLAWVRVRRDGQRRWCVILGLMLGVAAAGKLLHVLPGVLLILHLALRRPRALVPVLGTGLVALIALDPGLWLDPLGRFQGRLMHHSGYAPDVVQPWWLPLEALAGALPVRWHPEIFPLTLDPLWTVLGVSGLVRCARRPGEDRTLARMGLVWFVVCLGVLMVWPTRWAQHALVLVVPICLGVGFIAREALSLSSFRFGPSGSRPPAGG